MSDELSASRFELSAMSYELLTTVSLLFLSALSYEFAIAIMIRAGVPGKSAVGIGRQ